MTEGTYISPEAQRAADTMYERKQKSACFSRCGWSVTVITVVSTAVVFLLSAVISVLMHHNIDIASFYNKTLLYFNEILIAISIGAGALVLRGMPKAVPQKKKVLPGKFFVFFCISIALCEVCNITGTIQLMVWDSIMGSGTTDALENTLSLVDPVQMAICTAVIAPILEELFFRKLLIDRMRPHGELLAIFASAALFGLFHQNFSQFLYTFAFGIILAYMYCRTGSYWGVTLLHAAFNLTLGVIPMLVSPKILEFVEKTESITEEEVSALFPLLAEYALPLALYALYSAAVFVFFVIGTVMLIKNFKKSHIIKDESLLCAEDKFRAVALNPGMIVTMLLLGISMVLSLFM